MGLRIPVPRVAAAGAGPSLNQQTGESVDPVGTAALYFFKFPPVSRNIFSSPCLLCAVGP